MSAVRLPVRLAAPALLALLAFSAGSPAFAPKAGLTVSKVFTTRIELELDDLSIMANGMDMTDMLGGFEVSLLSELRAEVTDEYVTVSDGRPTKLRRTYDELSNTISFEFASDFDSSDETFDVQSLLENVTVLFEWDPDEDDYVASFADGEGDDELLEGLLEDMDLRRLLPNADGGDLDEGDTWKIDPKLLGPVLVPGGLLGFRPESEDEEAAEAFETIFGGQIEEVLRSLLDGSVVCTYVGTEQVDDVEVGVIEVAIEIDSSTDLVEFLETLVADLSAGEELDISIEQADLSFEIEGTARLSWDLAAGHFHSFEATADMAVTFELSASGEGQEIEVVIEVSGALELGATLE